MDVLRLKVAAILCFVFFLAGCKNASTPLDRAMTLRNSVLESNGCSFQATVSADYGEKYYVFSMDCVSDKEGNLKFTVISPETISGITGQISTEGGALTFDDKLLTFPTIADGQITPVTTPWLFIKTLRSGYMNSCTSGSDGYQLSIDDSYADSALRLFISVENDLPVLGEIYWKGSRVLSIHVENFTYL